MKSQIASNFRNAAHATQKITSTRSSALKYAAHRYERRKIREYLRLATDIEEATLRLERLG